MHEKMIEWKMGFLLFLYAVAELLGWKGILLVAWTAAMTLDYISGTMAACKAKEWSSNVARNGLWHKAGMILVVTVSGITDIVMAVICKNLQFGIRWPGIVLPLVVSWYILTEFGSILENAVKMGAPVPAWFVKMLKTSILAVDKKAEEIKIKSK